MRNRSPGESAGADLIIALPRSSGGLSRSRRWTGALVAAVGLPLLTIVLVTVRSTLAVESMLLIYLLAVVVVAAVGGVAAALLAAVASFLLVNWFLTPPYYTFAVENREAAINLVVFVLAGILVSVTVELGARNREAAQRTRMESRLISQLSSAEIGGASLLVVLEHVRGLFAMTTVALVDPAHADSPLASVGPHRSEPPSLRVTAPDGLKLEAYGPEVFAEDRRLLGVLAAMASRAWQGQRLAEQAAHAHQLAETDRVRSGLLTAVSHDLRTPLAAIKAAASSLRQEDIAWTDEERRELLLTVDESTDRLTDLIANLLDMSRLQAGAVSVHLNAVALDEVVARALLGTEQSSTEKSVTVDVPEDLPLVHADAGLLERVVANLVDNARRYSPSDVPVLIRAEGPRNEGPGNEAPGNEGPGNEGPGNEGPGNEGPRNEGPGNENHLSGGPDAFVSLHVTDRGPGIPQSQWSTMFAPFQRLGDHDATPGLGLGLAIAQGFTEAMHARLTPSATPGGGLTMTITVPVATITVPVAR